MRGCGLASIALGCKNPRLFQTALAALSMDWVSFQILAKAVRALQVQLPVDDLISLPAMEIQSPPIVL